ncbi:MAG: heme exporter protein CcmB [Acidimicrobiia bacterium]|nr:heme exporter protein CcmB [Acidimicrobiia bacterium]
MADGTFVNDAALVAAKDLRLELRSRVAVSQVVPFAVLLLVIFGFALDGDQTTLQRLTSGLYWVAVLFAAVLIVQRAFAVESDDGVRDALRLAGMRPASVFVGKAGAIFVQLIVLEVLLGVGVAVFFGTTLTGWGLLIASAVVAAAGISAAGTLYGVLTAGLRVKESLLPMLLLPVLAPVLIGATRAMGAALGDVAVDGWSWFNFLAIFALIYVALGLFAFGPLLEES